MAKASAIDVLIYIVMMMDELREIASSIASEKLLSLMEASADAAREQIDELSSSGPKLEK